LYNLTWHRSFILLSACNRETSNQQIVNEDTTSPSTDDKATSKEIEVVYESCAVYASSTKFYFKPAQGDLIEISVWNEGMEDYPSPIKLPNNLLEDDENIEGPLGANPEVIGKKYILIYNEVGEVTEIRPMK
jgi:hypothetical protein